MDVFLDGNGGVEVGGEVVALGQLGDDLRHAGLGGLHQFHGVIAVFHHQAQPDRRDPVEAGDARDGGQAVLDGGDVLQGRIDVVGVPSPVDDGQVLEVLDRDGLAHGAHFIFLQGGFHETHGDFRVLGGDGADDLVGGQLAGVQLVVVHPDVDLPVD